MKPRDILSDLVPYEPGKPIEDVQKELDLKEVFKMASNENALGPSPKALKAIQDNLGKIHRYPDGNCTLLKEDLGKFYDVLPAQVIVGNGSDELLQLIAMAYLDPGDTVLTSKCTFSEYEFSGKLMGAPVIKVPLRQWIYDLDAMKQAITPQTKIIYISNPNNPTGTYLTHDQIRDFMEQIDRRIIVVLDEAYVEYVRASDFPQSIKLLKLHPNLMVLRTFSKIYGLAGLRVGYGMASQELIRTVHKVKEPFNVNSLAQVGARAALQDKEHVQKSQKLVWQQLPLLETGLKSVGCKTLPTQTNFVFAQTPIAGRYVFQQLLQQGIIVRPMDSFGETQAIRVTVSTIPEIGKLLGLLPKVFTLT